MNSLKITSLGMYGMSDRFGGFPAAIVDGDGRPLLSWRVAILPFLDDGGAGLYREFHLDEPCDSDHNKALLADARGLRDAGRERLGRAPGNHGRHRRVLIEKKWGPPLVCNDGATILQEIDLEDPEENLGGHKLREAAERTADVVGDGTTTATLLAFIPPSTPRSPMVAAATGFPTPSRRRPHGGSVPKRLRGFLADRPRAVAALTKIFLAEIERLFAGVASSLLEHRTATTASTWALVALNLPR